jgi:hypothetical protein
MVVNHSGDTKEVEEIDEEEIETDIDEIIKDEFDEEL